MHLRCKQQNILSDLVDIHLTFICCRAKRFRIVKKRVYENVNRCARANAATIYICILIPSPPFDPNEHEFSSTQVFFSSFCCLALCEESAGSSPLLSASAADAELLLAWQQVLGLRAGCWYLLNCLAPLCTTSLFSQAHRAPSVGLVLAGSWSLPWQHKPHVSDRCS